MALWILGCPPKTALVGARCAQHRAPGLRNALFDGFHEGHNADTTLVA